MIDSRLIAHDASPADPVSISPDRPVALVTGSTSGIGEAVARRLARDGHAVVIHSRQSVARGRALATELGGHYVAADLADDAQRTLLVEQATAAFGRLDVLVNNAGISHVIPHDDLDAATPDIWQSLYEVNVVAPFRLVSAAAPGLRASAAARGRPACVINISSHAGVRPKGASLPYAASKAALNHVTRLLALTLGPEIRVNAVAPGLVDTPMTVDWHEARTRWNTQSAMRRAATPDDIAQLVSSLIASDYLTGEILVADGGLNLR